MAGIRLFWRGKVEHIPAQEGESILSALRRAGVTAPESPCGGNGTCKKCLVEVDGLGQVLACRTPVTGECTVRLPQEDGGAVVAEEGRSAQFPLTPGEGLGAAVDIGTTTVVVHLYDLATGARLGTRSGVNSQRAFGHDVITRIQYATGTPDGLAQLTGAIRAQLGEYLEQLCREAGRGLEQLRAVTVAANTVMEHLYTGLSPATIAVAPFTPLSLFGQWLPGPECGLPAGARVYLCPAVAGYVGGDITAGILSSGAYTARQPTLFLDIGTNGEMALGDGTGEFLCCATAAGPAFEGAVISQGMAAADGAISKVELENGQVRCHVLGGGPAQGICGSGLVDALAVMLRLGAVDETGRLLPPEEAPDEALPFLEEDGEGGVRFLLAPGVAVTEEDVRQLQLAKAAIAAGIATLLEQAGLEAEGLGAMYLAGGFGNYIRPESAAAIGLFPAVLLQKLLPVGNSAGAGAAAVLLSRQAMEQLDGLPRHCRYIELSGHKSFNSHYIECMMFEEM